MKSAVKSKIKEPEQKIENNTAFKSHEIILGKNVKVTTDRNSKTRVVNFPFDFPNGDMGVLIVCKVKNADWIPSDDIVSININFK